MANTTNLNLVKLSGSEKLKTYPTNQAGNMDTIDAAFGAGFGANGKPNVNTSINNLADGLAIIANGNTHAAITSGQYVYVRNHGSLSEGLYVATANISANGTLSGSNLTADTAGGLNSVYASLNSNIEPTVIASGTVASIESALLTVGNALINGDAKNIRFTISTASGLFNARDYAGTIRRRGLSRYIVNVSSLATDDIEGFYDGSTWSWSSLRNSLSEKPDIVSLGSITASSVSFEGDTGTFGIVSVHGAAAARTGLYVFRVTSTNMYLFPIHDDTVSTNITVTTSGKTVTIANSHATSSAIVNVLLFAGSITKL